MCLLLAKYLMGSKHKIQFMCPELTHSGRVRECTSDIFIHVTTVVQMKSHEHSQKGKVICQVNESEWASWKRPHFLWILKWIYHQKKREESLRKVTFTLSGLVSAKNHQLLWGEWGRMDLGAYSSVWLTWVVETWQREDGIWLVCGIHVYPAAQTGLESFLSKECSGQWNKGVAQAG